MRAVIYCRTSTKNQKTDSQMKPLQELAERSQYDVVEVVEDIGVSGAVAGRRREGMGRVMEMVNRREVDVVLVYSVDRLGRNLTDVILLVEELEQKGVALVIHKNGVDTATAYGKTLLSFFALVAQMERDFIKARVSDGMAAAREKGRMPGRPKISSSKEYEIEELLRSGKGINSIAKQLGVGNGSVSRVKKRMAA